MRASCTTGKVASPNEATNSDTSKSLKASTRICLRMWLMKGLGDRLRSASDAAVQLRQLPTGFYRLTTTLLESTLCAILRIELFASGWLPGPLIRNPGDPYRD